MDFVVCFIDNGPHLERIKRSSLVNLAVNYRTKKISKRAPLSAANSVEARVCY